MDDGWYIWTKTRNATRTFKGLTTTTRKNRLNFPAKNFGSTTRKFDVNLLQGPRTAPFVINIKTKISAISQKLPLALSHMIIVHQEVFLLAI